MFNWFQISMNFKKQNNSQLPTMSYTFRNFKPGDCQMIISWANLQGSNKGLYDHLGFELLNKQTFWIGQLDGEPISSMCGAQFDDNFATIGLYFVKPQHRFKGYGIQVWNQGMKHVTAKNIALQGSLKQQKNYNKSGFITNHKTIRFLTYDTNNPYNSPFLIPCKDVDFEKLNKFDRKNFPGPRKEFLAQWIVLPKSHSIAFVRDGQIQGYGVVRISDEGFKIGPLFANSLDVSEEILKNLIGFVPKNTKTTIDIPQVNSDGLRLQENFKMIKQFECTSMYTNGMPQISYQKTVYGLTCLQFG